MIKEGRVLDSDKRIISPDSLINWLLFIQTLLFPFLLLLVKVVPWQAAPQLEYTEGIRTSESNL